MQEPLRILVAEPPLGSASTLLASLAATRLDLDLHFVQNSASAFAALGSNGYDCALVDSRLADGVRLLNQLRALGVDTPIMLVTADEPGPMARELLAAGAADCLSGPDLAGGRLSRHLINAVRSHRTGLRLAAAEKSLAEKSTRDDLTKLPTRAAFFHRLSLAVTAAIRAHEPLALLVLDLNGFNKINQTLGPLAGDRVLCMAADRLRHVVREPEALARVGDDEFAVFLTRNGNRINAVATATKLVEALRAPFTLEGQDHTVGTAIGVALLPAHGDSAEVLWRSAAIALREAKRTPNGFVIHSSGDARPDQLTLANDLRLAVDNNELALHYQPKISLRRGGVVGMEALLRWNHPRYGLLYPDVFIPLSEQIGVIGIMTEWVLDAALAQCRAWQRDGRDLTVSINVSALTLHDVGFPRVVENLLRKWRVDPGHLVLEITESAIILDTARAIEIINHLHGIGVSVAIDDFGTGYTSLAYIRKLPVQELKIDKSFVKNMRTNADDAVIVRTIVELGRNLGLQVVAEGVEDQATFDMLAKLGCNVAQGYLMSRPLSVEQIDEWLRVSPWGLAAAASKRRPKQARIPRRASERPPASPPRPTAQVLTPASDTGGANNTRRRERKKSSA